MHISESTTRVLLLQYSWWVVEACLLFFKYIYIPRVQHLRQYLLKGKVINFRKKRNRYHRSIT
jgi:hypothetical protein